VTVAGTGEAATWAVHAYDPATLRRLLKESSQAEQAAVDNNLHSVYFEEYFAKLDARTIVIERPYVDRDFLEDFAAYYVRCFDDYRRFCTRLHFFSSAFDADQFSGALRAVSKTFDDALKAAYLGFIVVKPLPGTIIGRTCLKTYPPENKRSYPITRNYDVNLMGLGLTVRTLAFQEQDRVAAACATSALWSAFHGTGIKFQHPIPSPVEITRAATRRGGLDVRAFPSQGLTSNQMMDAAREAGLDPILLSGRNPNTLRACVYAYLNAGIPTLLIGELYDKSRSSPLGLHAVTVTGFSLSDELPDSDSAVRTISERIEKFFCHDDQVGPFARMNFLPTGGLSTSWKDADGKMGNVIFRPTQFLVPLYHKIRIPFLKVLIEVAGITHLLDLFRLDTTPDFPPKLIWDVRLSDVAQFKRNFRERDSLSPEVREQVLAAHMPRFIWVADGRDADGRNQLTLVFDATAIETENFCLRVVEYDQQVGDLVRSLNVKIPDLLRHRQWAAVATRFLR
jgi:hypothetical protein